MISISAGCLQTFYKALKVFLGLRNFTHYQADLQWNGPVINSSRAMVVHAAQKHGFDGHYTMNVRIIHEFR